MALIHNATFDSGTRVLSLLDKAGNVISSCEVPSKELVDDITKPLTFKATRYGSTVKLTSEGSPSGSFQTSRDGGKTWVDYTKNTAIPLNTGDEVSFRAKTNRTSAQTASKYFYFVMEGKIEAWHNVMSLYRTNDFATYNTTMSNAFYSLFRRCASLTKAPALPATTLYKYCYENMFRDCTSLTQAPALPATTLAYTCYSSMFYKCTSLTEAPALPATTLADTCYSSMFYGCTSLTKAPALPATTLYRYCYWHMFYGCTSLTKAPALPATTLAEDCYVNMFCGCTSLTQAPALPATTLKSHCYENMFYGCYRLNEVRCQMPSSYSSSDIPTYTSNWLYSVSSTGTFYTNADANWSSGASGIPEGWTRHNINALKALTLTATADNSSVKLTKNGTLDNTFEVDKGNGWEGYAFGTVIPLNAGESCKWRCSAHPTTQSDQNYVQFVMTGKIEASGNVNSMLSSDFENLTSLSGYDYAFRGLFKGCTSLTQAPQLSATALVLSCYASMFEGCTSLTQAPQLPATTLETNCYASMFEGCTSLTQAPALPAKALAASCYGAMFWGCSKLNEVRIAATTTETYALNNWLRGVSATGDFYCDPNATIFPTDSVVGIPKGWVRHALADYPVTP